MSSRPTPDVVIVGAPKCGTTALNAYLAAHPAVFMAAKEQHFFGTDLTFWQQHPTLEEYLGSFAKGGRAHKRGEASVWYLYSQRAAQEIHAHNPQTQIIAMVRNPADMLYSLHSQYLRGGGEDIVDFGEALAAESDRKQGRRIPHGNMSPWWFYYSEIPRYREQLERYLATFDRDQIHLILYDDLVADPRGTYRRVLEFLGVDASFVPELAIHNANLRIRNAALHKAVYSPSRGVRWAGRTLLPSQSLRQQLRRGLFSAVERVNMTVAERETLDPALRARLTREFKPEIEWLAEQLGRNLGHWLAAASGSEAPGSADVVASAH